MIYPFPDIIQLIFGFLQKVQVQYDSIDTITQPVNQFGQGALMAKTDIKDAFWIIPIHPGNHRLLCFSWYCFYYYDKCLPMGASSF